MVLGSAGIQGTVRYRPLAPVGQWKLHSLATSPGKGAEPQHTPTAVGAHTPPPRWKTELKTPRTHDPTILNAAPGPPARTPRNAQRPCPSEQRAETARLPAVTWLGCDTFVLPVERYAAVEMDEFPPRTTTEADLPLRCSAKERHRRTRARSHPRAVSPTRGAQRDKSRDVWRRARTQSSERMRSWNLGRGSFWGEGHKGT